MIPELKTFIAVAQHGTFSAAAERVGLTQAAVSGHIKRLEERLGFLLFDRSGHSAKLNTNGYRTLARAKTIVQLIDALGDADDETLSRDLRIGVIASAQSTMLARALVLFRERYAKQRVHVLPGVSLHLLDQVDTGEIDLAILIRPPFELPPDTRWTSLARDPYVLIVPESCTDTDWRRILQTQPFLRYDRLSFGGRQVDRFLRSLPFPITEAAEIPVQSMVTMVANGLGVAILPLASAHLSLPSGVRAVPLQGKNLFREVGMVVSRQSTIEPTVNYLKDCLIEVADTGGSSASILPDPTPAATG